MQGQYNPTNPAEPGVPTPVYTLTLQADPPGGGSFNVNATTSYAEGTTVNLNAYTSTNFTFVSWELDGKIVSTTASLKYTMPAHNVKLIAHYRYTPTSPTEPVEPVMPVKPVYSNLYLDASPASGGSFNISSGNSYEVGSSVSVQASNNTNFTFVNWTCNGEVVSTSKSYTYTMLANGNTLTANYRYTPASPNEPSEAPVPKVYHTLFLQCNPSAGGYFNVGSSNSYEEGSTVSLYAYNNEWYTFTNWTQDGEVISTSSSLKFTIPTNDVTLTANYIYNYNPSNPIEPAEPTDKKLSLYGMTENSLRGQTIIYPVYLENTEEMLGATVVLHFPKGFAADCNNVVLGERAIGHSLVVTALDDNAYRFDLTSDGPFTGRNGKIFEIPVTVSDTATTNRSYQVTVSNGARINADGSKDVISTRSGYIYVKEVREDGLYAAFSYEKLQNRMKFTNLSSEKALHWSWDFGDGTTSDEREPLHVYATSGYYDVKLTVMGQTGTDIASATILINDESSWRVNGVFYLTDQEIGVRHFSSAQTLMHLLGGSPVDDDVKILIKAGLSFHYPLTSDNLAALQQLIASLSESSHRLTIEKEGEGGTPILLIGTEDDEVTDDIVTLFAEFGRSLAVEGVDVRLCGISFNPSQIEPLKNQTVSSGKATSEVDLSLISKNLDFSWQLASSSDNVQGAIVSGNGNIPAMTLVSEGVDNSELIYHVIGAHEGTTLCEFNHTITIQPTMIGSFSHLSPDDKIDLGSTTVTLTWNSIKNAVYDVYLWNAANQRPTTPTVSGTNELSYTTENFCQDGKTYKWQVIARNSAEQLQSDIYEFTIRSLPNLHIYSLDCTEAVAGKKFTVTWTVGNDGRRATTTSESWNDYVWLVPDVYAGTEQKNCKLMAMTSNVRQLEVGGQYTASIKLNLDYNQYGSYYLIVASDMSSVTNIEWTSVGGTIVNPYTPTLEGDGYRHLYALTYADGNKVAEEDETSIHSDNFFYKKIEIAAPSLEETDWQTLKEAYTQMGNGEGWSQPWNFESETNSIIGLPGVQLREGRVVGVDLSGNSLSGTFPTSLLKLSHLEMLDLHDNNLTGDIGLTMRDFMEQNPAQEVTVKNLNVSGNMLSGNIGLFAQYYPLLESLDASDNKLEEVVPMISSNVTDLNLSKQDMEKTVDIQLGNLTADALLEKLPTILLYNHTDQIYGTNIHLLCTTKNQSWGIQMSCENGTLTMPYVTPSNVYYGQSGDTLSVEVINKMHQPIGSSFEIKLEFDEGDGNFDGSVDILDLQTVINYIFDDYMTRPFNYTAANLWQDTQINVQDIVKLVTLLMQNAPKENELAEARSTINATGSHEAVLFIRDGNLILQSNKPVAAFDLMLSGVTSFEISKLLQKQGFVNSIERTGTTIHLIGYSLSGGVLPIGENIIGSVKGYGKICHAMLADKQAERINATIGEQPTGMWTADKPKQKAKQVYRLIIGADRAIIIDSNGNKRLSKENHVNKKTQ